MLELRRFPGMAAVPGLVHAVTTRAGGVSSGPYASLNLGRVTGDADASVAENRRRVAGALGLREAVRFPVQVHGAVVVPADRMPAVADAVVCSSAGVAVGVLGADCPGVLLVDPDHRALAIAHSGWRGTVAGVVPAALSWLVRFHGADPARVRAAIGPCISAARYEVGAEVAEAVAAHLGTGDGVVAPGRANHFHVDLVAAIRLQLATGGVPAASIESLPHCTFEDAAFFSHRRDGARTGRHALVAAWVD